MTKINDYLIQSELAMASYGSFLGNSVIVTDLTDLSVGMSPTQATDFVEKWQVSAQYTDPVTGVSATVFEEVGSGTKHLAIRGTQPVNANDIVSDLLLAAGWPPEMNPQFLALKLQIENIWLQDPAVLQGQNFTVTDHSLGGYLAAAVKSSFPQVTQGYIFNAPGVGGPIGNLADSLANVLGLGGISTDNLWNVRSSEGISIIAGLGYQLGAPVNIQTEATNSHGISTLVDALAVQAVYADLATALTETQLNSLIDAFGSLKDSTGAPIAKILESALDALRFIALGTSTSKTDVGNRDALYTNLNDTAFKAKLAEWASTTQFTLLTGKTGGEILGMAKGTGAEGLATRHALVAGNPFVLTGANYGAFSDSGALDLFDPVNGAGTITDQYLIDRTTLLTRKLWFNTNDENPYNPSAQVDSHNFNIHQYLKSDIYFEDAATGYKIQQGALFDNTPRYYFGDDSAETPAGSASKDRLYGGGGDDTLQGLEGYDYLEGGTGTDTYIVNQGDGIDTILDMGGFCVIQFDTVVERDRTVIANDSNQKTGDRGAIHA